MSHKATNWAFQQRGLDAATWRVLVMLADRHNPDYGCFPSQNQIAADAEIGRSTLNRHLDKLEQAGLIRRERRIDLDTRKQKSTRYFLAFEDGFEVEPCAKSGHGNSGDKPGKNPENSQKAVSHSRVPNRDTNPVSIKPVITTTAPASGEPVENSDPQNACLAAAGPGLCLNSRRDIVATVSVIDGWLAEGFDLEADILPVIRQRTERMRGGPIRTWAYFTQPIRSAHEARTARAAPSQNAENSMVPAAGPDSAPQAPGQADAEARLRFFADWINSTRYLPPSAVTNTTTRALLARGLVTKDRLHQRGIRIIEGDAR